MSTADGMSDNRTALTEATKRLAKVRSQLAIALFEYDRARERVRGGEAHFASLQAPYEIWRDVAAQYWVALEEYSRLLEASTRLLKHKRIFRRNEVVDGAANPKPAVIRAEDVA